MTDWLREIARLQQAGVPSVLITVAGVRGSAPREVGAKMLVTANEIFGTIGGGELEYQSVRIAANQLQSRDTAGRLRRFPLGSNCGQCCGGVVDMLFEPVAGIACVDELLEAWSARQETVLVTELNATGEPVKSLRPASNPARRRDAASAAVADRGAGALLASGSARRVDTPGRGDKFMLLEPVTDSDFTIAVFGAGHVGSALVQLLSGLDCNLRWLDSRRDIFPDTLPGKVQRIECADPARDVAALPVGTYFFVMTHSHALDLDIIAAILRRGDFAYCGLIGSATKRRRFDTRLRSLGINEQALQRLVCPIGIRGISGKKPQEIAIAAAAEVLQHRERSLAARSKTVATLHTLNAR